MKVTAGFEHNITDSRKPSYYNLGSSHVQLQWCVITCSESFNQRHTTERKRKTSATDLARSLLLSSELPLLSQHRSRW